MESNDLKILYAHRLAEELNRQLCYGISSEDLSTYRSPFFIDKLIEELELIKQSQGNKR